MNLPVNSEDGNHYSEISLSWKVEKTKEFFSSDLVYGLGRNEHKNSSWAISSNLHVIFSVTSPSFSIIDFKLFKWISNFIPLPTFNESSKNIKSHRFWNSNSCTFFKSTKICQCKPSTEMFLSLKIALFSWFFKSKIEFFLDFLQNFLDLSGFFSLTSENCNFWRWKL